MATAFWIADGEKYVKEATVSALSLQRQMPDVKRILFSTKIGVLDGFDKQIKLPRRRHKWWYQDSVDYMNWAARHLWDNEILYLDTDTYVCEPLYDVLELLKHYDIVATHAPGRVTCGYDGVPAAFPEVNVGVLGITNAKMKHLFMEWKVWYDLYPDRYGNNDQGALRETLWHNPDIRLYIMPPEYNLRWCFGAFLRYPVKVLHGRTDGDSRANDYEAIREKVNWSTDLRAWERGSI